MLLALAGHASAFTPPTTLRGRLKDALVNNEPLRTALNGAREPELLPLLGPSLAPRVSDLLRAEAPPPAYPIGAFEERALELMSSNCWIEAHDVVTGELAGYEGDGGNHAHDAELAARLLEGICQHELACSTGLGAALAAHDVRVGTPLACGCTVPPEVIEPFADLARALATIETDANAALGHALAAALARPSLAGTANVFAARAEALIVDDDAGAAATVEAAPVVADVDDDDAPGLGGRVAADELPSLAALHKLVGLKEVKAYAQNLKDATTLEKERGDDPKLKIFSCVLTGNPGTGKTSFAALYGELLGELRVVPAGRVVRLTGAQLQDGGPKGLAEVLETFDQPGDSTLEVGDTVEVRRNGVWGNFGRIVHHDTSADARPQFKNTYDIHFGKMTKIKLADGSVETWRDHDFDIGVRRKDIRAADETGGVLVIDDAHQLETSDKGARNALYLLAEEMDKRGGRLAVVVAGYEKKVYEEILGFNTGMLANRIRRRFELSDFSDPELIELLESELERTRPAYHVADDKHVRIAARRVGKGRGSLGFGNARAVQNLLDAAVERQTARVVAERRAGLRPDIFEFQRDDLLGQQSRLLDPETCTPLRKLYEMEGLEQVKSSVDGLLKLAESNAQREEQELPIADVSLNRVFLGNPGTGKTTVAALYGQILKELGLLSIGDVVLATPVDLIGSALGQSEEKTNALLDRALGCVLVIDEAYGLDPAGAGSFTGPGGGGAGGDPYKTAVIDTLVSRVQGDAGADRCVLLLGYRKEMERFIRRGNPGLARRFQLENAFQFDDYDDQALLRILLRNVARRGKQASFSTAKAVVRRDLAKARMRPNFGNAGAVDNAVSAAVVRAEARLAALPAAERASRNELTLADFIVEKPHMEDPSIVFDGLIGCENIKTRLAEYQAVLEAAARAGRDPIDDLALTFCFQGSPGTGKTTVARRMGMLFEALGILPSADVVQVSASQFSTGFVGQTAAQTRDIFDSARGAVLFIDEAYRLYDPAGRSYMQEAIDEIVNLLTEEQYRGKMAVIFAGYSGQMSDMLDKVNPGLKSRVSDVIDFPDFSAGEAAEIAAAQLDAKGLTLPAGAGADALTSWTRRLVAAPAWANGRDVETFVRRAAIECATRKTAEVTPEALDAALASVLALKGGNGPTMASPPPPMASPFATADPLAQNAFNFDLKKAIETAKMDDDGDDDDDEVGEPIDFADALEEAIVELGYDADSDARAELAQKLKAAIDGTAPFPEELRAKVAAKTGADAAAVDAAMERRARPVLAAVTAAIAYEKERESELEELDDEERDEEEDKDAKILDRLRQQGPCPAGFAWFRQGNGWRCGGGQHFVYDDDPMLEGL